MNYSFRNFLFLFFLFEIAGSIFLSILSYAGNDSPEWRTQILKYFTEEDIKKGEDYDRSGYSVLIVSILFNASFLSFFVFSNASQKLENFCARVSRNNYAFTFSLYLLVYLGLKTILDLPFKFYFGYTIEHEFGFSKMNISDWIIFTLKGNLVGFAIILPVSLGGFFIIKKFNSAWIFILPILTFLGGMIFSVALPEIITPIFYDRHPIPKGELRTKILTLCESAKIGVEDISVIDESKYSGHTNAYFTGWGNAKKIVLFDTMLKTNSDEEIMSVLGHEIGHWKKNHVLKELTLQSIEVFLLCIFSKFLFEKIKLSGSVSVNEIFSPSTIPFLLLVISLFNFTLSPINNSLSRKFESDADFFALELTKNPKASLEAEIKLARDNRSRLNPHPIYVIFNYSHPVTLDRIRMAENFKK